MERQQNYDTSKRKKEESAFDSVLADLTEWVHLHLSGLVQSSPRAQKRASHLFEEIPLIRSLWETHGGDVSGIAYFAIREYGRNERADRESEFLRERREAEQVHGIRSSVLAESPCSGILSFSHGELCGV